ncbi:hypothetical protein ACM26V_02550 [Salipaludibacillus sp. HK11]
MTNYDEIAGNTQRSVIKLTKSRCIEDTPNATAIDMSGVSKIFKHPTYYK